jgi:hypothetical protein
MALFRRHFVFGHPLFRASKTPTGVPWRGSVYYLWWEYLGRHQGYKLTCKQKGNGKYAKLYRDFGNVHSTDFQTWWTKGERGANLFAEPAAPMTVAALKPSDLQSLTRGWNDKALLVISVPLTFRKRFAEEKIKILLKEHFVRKRGERLLRESRALYPLTMTGQPNIEAWKRALEVYDYKIANPKAKLWEIAQAQKFVCGGRLTAVQIAQPRGKLDPGVIEKKNKMSVAVSRKLKMAKAIIKNVGEGKFPGRH